MKEFGYKRYILLKKSRTIRMLSTNFTGGIEALKATISTTKQLCKNHSRSHSDDPEIIAGIKVKVP